SNNPALPWTIDLLQEYSDKWNWEILSTKEFLPWDDGLLELYSDRWDWAKISKNRHISWSVKLLEKFKDELIGAKAYGIFHNSESKWNLALLYLFVELYTGAYWNSNLYKDIWKILEPFVDDDLIKEVLEEYNK